MKLKLEFFNSEHCKSNAHCNICRDIEGGRKWRKNLINSNLFYDLKLLNEDFECPKDIPWGFIHQNDITEKIFQENKMKNRDGCGGCGKAKKELTKLLGKEKYLQK